MIANEGKLDRFDGDEDPQYIADIKAFMKKTFDGWQSGGQDEDYLQWYADSVAEDFQAKFPFTISRFDEKCSMDKDRANYVNIPKNALGESTQRNANVKHNRGGTTIVSRARVIPTKDPRTSAEDLRTAQVNVT